MRVENRPPAAAVTSPNGRPYASTRSHPQATFAAHAGTPAAVALARFGDALPSNDFLRNLYREKRRVERSHSPLSIVLYELGDAKETDPRNVDRLVEALHNTTRETDILGHVRDDKIAVLCPDTDEAGSKCLMRKIAAYAGELPFTAVSATYPHDLFDHLDEGAFSPMATRPLLMSDTAATPQQPYQLKRGLDLIGALLALALLWPLMLGTAAAIALNSRGPILFKQTRLGRGGVPFTFYKFRSMVMNGDDAIHRNFVSSLINEGDGQAAPGEQKQASYKLMSDPRVTAVGRIIRKTSIDELPQLFNVIKGDMSLVGPRPPIPYEAVQYQPWHLRRILNIKPGITGLWQVDGRSRVTFNEMVRMDLRYIRDCSLVLDLKILIKTVLVVFRCDGAV